MARVISGAAADWLASRRGELNQRFERSQRRFPSLSPDTVLSILADTLPPLAGPEPNSGDLLSSVYDLVLLQAGRDVLAARLAVDVLLREVFPKIRPLLLQRPSTLPGALSNAVENMGTRGSAFARALCGVSETIERSDTLLDAMAVVAWRLGEARLRESALAIATRLPAKVLLRALDVEDLPDEAAPLIIEGLRVNGWRHPRRLLSETTVGALSGAAPDRIQSLKEKVVNAVPSPLPSWTIVASVGDFAGFDGNFDCPPVVLDGGGTHQLFARCGAQDFCIDADVFGWICRPQPSVDLPVRLAAAPSAFRRLVARLSTSSDTDKLLPDGTLTVARESARLAGLANATSYVILAGIVAATHPDSHRIRIAASPGEPL